MCLWSQCWTPPHLYLASWQHPVCSLSLKISTIGKWVSHRSQMTVMMTSGFVMCKMDDISLTVSWRIAAGWFIKVIRISLLIPKVQDNNFSWETHSCICFWINGSFAQISFLTSPGLEIFPAICADSLKNAMWLYIDSTFISLKVSF